MQKRKEIYLDVRAQVRIQWPKVEVIKSCVDLTCKVLDISILKELPPTFLETLLTSPKAHNRFLAKPTVRCFNETGAHKQKNEVRVALCHQPIIFTAVYSTPSQATDAKYHSLISGPSQPFILLEHEKQKRLDGA